MSPVYVTSWLVRSFAEIWNPGERSTRHRSKDHEVDFVQSESDGL